MVVAVGLNPTWQRTVTVSAIVPGEVIRCDAVREDAAGKGLNVARVVGQLGGRATHVSWFSGRRGEMIRAACASEGIVVAPFACDAEARVCTTVIGREPPSVTELVEPGGPVDDGAAERFLDAFEAAIADADGAALCGSAAPGFPVDIYAQAAALLRTQRPDAELICDIRGAALERLLRFHPEIVKINVDEFLATFVRTGVPGDPLEKRAAAVAILGGNRYGVGAWILTDGARPTIVAAGDDPVVEVEPIALEPVNTIGCGDAFLAGLIVARADGDSLADAVDHGHAAAAMNASLMKPGSIRPE